ncbi:MAG: OmpA family protein [Paludibacter sp.]|nr:OmpA family protein [Paludibacter sp.]
MINKAVITLLILFNTVILFAQNDALIKSVRVVSDPKKQSEDVNVSKSNSSTTSTFNTENSEPVQTQQNPIVVTPQTELQKLNAINIYNDPNSNDPNRLANFDALLEYVIMFDFNSATVRSRFFGTLKQLGQLLKDNDTLKLEIQGHTDNVGDDFVNVKFSERRANSVKRILVKYGISEERLRITGFGSSVPVVGNTNSTPAERAQNRRVVFKAISDKDLVKVNKIMGKLPENVTERDMRTLKSTMSYENSNDPLEVKWRYKYSILFRYRSSRVGTEYQPLLRALSSVINNNSCLILDMSAHTDSLSSDESNMRLSMKRSQAVWDVLALNGVERTRVEVANFGENKPVNNSENAAEVALNRRVAFTVSPKGCQLNLDSLLTQELLQTYKGQIGNQRIVKSDGKFLIQTGAFQSENSALLMAVKLKDFVPDNIYIVQENGVHRVIIGFTNTRDEAMDVARLVQASGILANPANN